MSPQHFELSSLIASPSEDQESKSNTNEEADEADSETDDICCADAAA